MNTNSINTNQPRMLCNNCGHSMMRALSAFNETICNNCGMRHVWPATSIAGLALNSSIGNQNET